MQAHKLQESSLKILSVSPTFMTKTPLLQIQCSRYHPTLFFFISYVLELISAVKLLKIPSSSSFFQQIITNYAENLDTSKLVLFFFIL